MLRSGILKVGLAMTLGLIAGASCLSTSGLSGGGEPPRDGGVALPDTYVNPNPCGADLQKDLGNCGTCGKVCGFGANSFPLCTAGACKIGCNTGFGNCDGNDLNGCEALLSTDTLNCGTCGRACQGSTCDMGKCQPVNITARGDGGVPNGRPGGMAIDANNIYYSWYSFNTGMWLIYRTDKDGANPVTLVKDFPRYIPYIAVDAAPVATGFVYYPSSYTQVSPSVGPPTTADGALMKIAKSGMGAPIIVAGNATGNLAPGGMLIGYNSAMGAIVLDATSIYFTNFGGYNSTSGLYTGGSVAKCPLTGSCTPTFLVSDQAYGPVALAVDSQGFFFTLQPTGTNTGNIFRCGSLTAACPSPGIVESSQGNIYSMAVTATELAWVTPDNSAVLKAGQLADGGLGALTTVASSQRSPLNVVIDGPNAIWGNQQNPGTVMTCPLTGCVGNPKVVAGNQDTPGVIATDATTIYWANTATFVGGPGSVWKVAK